MANKVVVIMLFSLGLFLVGLGLYLGTIEKQETRYREVWGFEVPYTVTVYPYQFFAIMMIILGISTLIGSFYLGVKTEKKEPTPHSS